MSTLRWTLLLVGVLVMAGMVAWEWMGRRRRAEAAVRDRRRSLPPETEALDGDAPDDLDDWCAAELGRLGSLVEETRQSAPAWDEGWAPRARGTDVDPDDVGVAAEAWADDDRAAWPEDGADMADPDLEPADGRPSAASVPKVPEVFAAPAAAETPETPEVSDIPDTLDAPATAAKPPPEPAAGCVLAVHVAAGTNPDPADWLEGEDVVSALEGHGFVYGPRALYHWTVDGESVFSVANMLEPGWLDRDDLLGGEHRTPGILLLLPLPGPVTGTRAVDDLLTQARRLSHDLDAVLLDMDRQPLTLEAMENLFRRAAPYGVQRGAEGRGP